MSAADADGLREVIDKRLSWASLHWFPVRTRGGIKTPTIAAEIAPEIAKAIVTSGWLAAVRAEAARDALHKLADEVDPNGHGWTSVRDAERFKQRLHDRADRDTNGGA